MATTQPSRWSSLLAVAVLLVGSFAHWCGNAFDVAAREVYCTFDRMRRRAVDLWDACLRAVHRAGQALARTGFRFDVFVRIGTQAQIRMRALLKRRPIAMPSANWRMAPST